MVKKEYFLRCMGREVENTYIAIESAKFVISDDRDDLPLLLFSRIISSVESVITLEVMEQRDGALVLCRVVLETYIDIVNCVVNDEYKNVLFYEFCRQETKFLNFMLKDTNVDDGMRANADKRLEMAKRGLAKMKGKKEKTTISKRFESAGHSSWYYTIYNDLCRNAHGSLDALLGSHFSNGDVCARKMNGDINFYIWLVSELLWRSLVRIAVYYKLCAQRLSVNVRRLKMLCDMFSPLPQLEKPTTPPAPARPARPCW